MAERALVVGWIKIVKSMRAHVAPSIPVTRRQSVELGLADEAYVRCGGDYRIASLAWQYSWIGRPN